MFTLQTAAWLFAISIAASLGYVLGAMMATGAQADEDELERKPRRRRTRILHGQRSEPDVVMISPTEACAVRSVESRYVSPDGNLLRSGGYQPRPGPRPAAPTTGSGVQKPIAI